MAVNASQPKATQSQRRVVADRRAVSRGGRREVDILARREAVARSVAQLHGSAFDRTPVVLVVDDYADGRELTAEYLRFCGFHVEEASTGAEAIDKATSVLPDVVLLDLALPDFDGFELVARLKQCEKTKPLKVVVMTARVVDDVRSRVAATDIAMFIPKPCDPELLVVQLTYLLADQGLYYPATQPAIE